MSPLMNCSSQIRFSSGAHMVLTAGFAELKLNYLEVWMVFCKREVVECGTIV